MLYFMDKCLDANVVRMDGGDCGVDVIEVSDVIYQLRIMLHISKVGSGCARSVSIWIGSA